MAMPLIQTQDTNRADCCQTLLVAHKCSHLLDFGAHTHTHTHTTCCIAPQTSPYYAKYLHNNLACAYCLIVCGVTSISYGALNRVTSCHHAIHKFHPLPTAQTLHLQLRTCHATYNFHDI